MSFVNVYYYPITELGFPVSIEQLTEFLDSDERERFNRYKVDGAKNTFLISRWLLKTQIAKRFGQDAKTISFKYNENGKPSLSTGENLHFSISHTKTAIAIALSDTEIGIDIELIDRRSAPWKSAVDFLNEELAEVIASLENEKEKKNCFARYWTCLEARVKCEGSTLFSLKSSFGHDLPHLYKDGYFESRSLVLNKVSYQYFTAATKNDEQVAICVLNTFPKIKLFESDSCGSMKENGILSTPSLIS